MRWHSCVPQLRDDRHAAQIQHLVNDDPLTHLPNRLAAHTLLAQALGKSRGNFSAQSGEELSVLIICLNNFKIISSALGYGAGDQILVEAASRLRATTRASDIVARLAEDEFLIVSQAGTSDPLRYANDVLAAFTRPDHLFQLDLHVSANVGISLFPATGADVASLLKQADSALGSAKVLGRNTCRLFTSEMGLGGLGDVAQILIEKELRQALTSNELLLHYQPQIDMASGRVLAAEALVRWRHPVHGLLPPDRFIPAAENSELSNIETHIHDAEICAATIDLAHKLGLARLHLPVAGRTAGRRRSADASI